MLPPSPIPSLSSALAEEMLRLGAKVRVGFPFWLRLFLASDIAGITIGRTIYLRRAAEKGSEKLERLLRHELVHVQQVARLGLPRFLYRYVREYFALRRSGLDSLRAYAAISFEQEARVAEVLDQRNPDSAV